MKVHDTKWFYLEIYRHRLFLFFFFHTRITHINLLSCEVAYEMRKVLKTHLS